MTLDLDEPNSEEAYSPRQLARRVRGHTSQDGVTNYIRRKDCEPSTKLKQQRRKQKKKRKSKAKTSKPRNKDFEFAMAVLNYKLVVICATLMAAAAAAVMTVDASGDHHLQHPILGWIPTRSPCKGSIAECLAGEEFELDSEISRRILATTRYISYGALQRNTVPCSRRGASYYNCKPGAQANPYNRGCSRITRCRG
uniref:Rapid alkalinization factor 1 n=1 Tax=Gossypium raimondii TaxID=29730 RepID=A0A0D2ST97_GOSRA|nr:hypothetical protein B456_007G299900 [Gossypium raimondii]